LRVALKIEPVPEGNNELEEENEEEIILKE
jgi:hypothetical protein